MAEINNINAIIQYLHNVQDSDWSDPSIPIPEGLWVFDTETRIIYKGDGINLIGDLPPFWNIGGMEMISDDFNSKFPDLNGMDNQIIVVNSTGDGYAVGVLDMTELVNMDEIVAALNDIAEAQHTHDDKFYKKEEIDVILEQTAKPISEEERDVLSMMVLEELDDDAGTYANMPHGDIDKADITLNADGGEYVSSTHTHTENINRARVTLRVNVPDEDLDTLKNIFIEVSRDGGTTFACNEHTTNSMICGTYKFIGCDIAFNKALDNSVVNIGNITLDDRKGDVTNIEVIESNKTGIFDADNIGIRIGNAIVLSNGSTIIITKILSNKKIEFLGELVKGTYGIEHIYPLKYENTNRIISYVQDIQRGWELKDTPIEIVGVKDAGIGVIDDKIQIIGGINNSGEALNTTYEYDIKNKFWEKTIKFPTTVHGLQITELDGALYASAGYINGELSGDLRKYDDTWSKINNGGFEKRIGHNTESVSPKIITLFGENDDSGSMADIGTIEVYNTEVDVLHKHELPAETNKRSYAASTNKDSSIYLSGGHNKETGETLSDLKVCNVVDWEEIEIGPAARNLHCSVNINGKLVIYGGAGDEAYFNDLWEFDTLTKSWTKLADGPGSRQMCAYASDGTDNLYVHGGYGENGIMKDIWKYTRSTDTWTSLGNGPQLRRHSGSYKDGLFYLFGGDDGAASMVLHIFNTTTSEWTEHILGAIGPRYDHKSIIVGNTLFVYSGINAYNNYVSSLHKIDLTTLEVTSTTTPARRSNYMVTSPDSDTLLFFGGEDENGVQGDLVRYTISSDTWEHIRYDQILTNTDMIDINGQPYLFGGTDGNISDYVKTLVNDKFTKVYYKPENRNRHAGSVVGNNYYVSHGTYTNTQNTHWAYDLTSGKWTKYKDTPHRYKGRTSTIIDDYLYTKDGGNMYRVNLETYDREFLFTMPDDITSCTSNICKINDNQLFMAGGRRSDNTISASAFIYHIDRNEIEFVQDIPTAKRYVSLVHYGDYVYLLGGLSGNQYVYRFSLITKSWENVASSHSCYRNGVALVGSDVYMLGSASSDVFRVFHLDTHTWEDLNNIPDKYEAYKCVSAGTDLYAIFGFNTKYTETILRKFDTITRSWEIADDNTPFYTHGIVVGIYNGNIRFFGSHQVEVHKDCWEFNLDTHKWTQKASSPAHAQRCGAAIANNKIYIIGGSFTERLLQIYDIENDTWVTENIPFSAFYHFGTCSMGNKIYIHGGYRDLQYHKLLEYDPETSTWTELQGSPTTRWRHWMVSDDIDSIYVGGGEYGYTYPDSYEVWKYTRSTDTWTRLSDQPFRTFEMHATYSETDSAIYVNTFNGLWKYTIASNAWERTDSSRAVWYSGSLFHYGDSVYNLFGQFVSDNSYNQILRYNFNYLNWSDLPAMPTGLSNHNMFNIGDKLYVYGGITKSGAPNIYVYIYNTKTTTWTTITDDNLLTVFNQFVGGNILAHGNTAYAFGGDTGDYYLNDKLALFTPEFDFDTSLAIVKFSLSGPGDHIQQVQGTELDAIPFMYSGPHGRDSTMIRFIDKTGNHIDAIEQASRGLRYYDFIEENWISASDRSVPYVIGRIVEQVYDQMSTVDTLHTHTFTNIIDKEIYIIFTGNEAQAIDLPENSPYSIPSEAGAGNELILRLTNTDSSQKIVNGTSLKWN